MIVLKVAQFLVHSILVYVNPLYRIEHTHLRVLFLAKVEITLAYLPEVRILLVLSSSNFGAECHVDTNIFRKK